MTRSANSLGIPAVKPQDAAVVILPVPFEHTTSYGHGTKNGPAAILEASTQVELYNPAWGGEIQRMVKIATAPAAKGSQPGLGALAAKYQNSFLISLGGEHSITPELVKPFLKKYGDLSVLQIDAHSDLRDTYDGSKNSHACAMRRVQDLGINKIIQVGIRNTAQEEQAYIKKENFFWGNKYRVKDVLARLSDHVYLTFDVDGLDPAIMPATGTPEPNGLSYEQALELMAAVAGKTNIVTADFVELAPIKNIAAYDFIVAKLVYELIGFKFKLGV